jgi:CBS domain containing-hemolysin-like protein
MIPADRVLGVDEHATREQVLEFARQFGLPYVTIHRAGAPRAWFAYVRVAELATQTNPLFALVRPLPLIERQASKLEALQALRAAGEALGVVVDGGQALGIVNRRGLAEQFFRSEPMAMPGGAGE